MAKKQASVPTRTVGRPRSQKARQDILKSAYMLLKKKGIRSVGAQEIANGAGVSTATLYRWWNTKEALIMDACFEHAHPVLTYEGKGSPLSRLRDQVVRGAVWLRTEDGKVMARLITGIHGDTELHKIFLDRFLLPRRRMAIAVIKEAIAGGELNRDTDPELLIDALYGPSYYRWMLGHAPLTKRYAEALVEKIVSALRPS